MDDMVATTNLDDPELGTLRRLETEALTIGYFAVGRGPLVVLLHGFPYDVRAYAEVAHLLADASCRVVVPFLRGYGPTRYADARTVRSAEQAALASDVLDLVDASGADTAVVAGFDWGARAACAFAALWPDRCAGVVSVGGNQIHDLARAAHPVAPRAEAALWYQYYFLTERGRRGLARHRRELTRQLWSDWSPTWRFTDAEFARTAASFDNPDWVDTVVHSYRYRHGVAAGDPRYAALAQRLARTPAIRVPALDVVGAAGTAAPVGRGADLGADSSTRVIAGAGHNLPQERPREFARAVLELVRRVHAR
ncbi:alpha/beta hydrolase [Dactylosporangium sp. NPDC051484]|uniref:alpha/beta fold hydrolase n=1 Tax=Dactylosporangium sp. NPDC051484 TaxID=3154942 RepID=UPI00344E4F67